MTTLTREIDTARVESFVGKALGDLSGAASCAFAMLGDRLGLFRILAAEGALTSQGLAGAAGLDERYVREWLAGMGAAGYLDYDPATTEYTLPAEHEPALIQEGGPFFFGGVYEMLFATFEKVDRVAEVFRSGGGVPLDTYSDHWWNGLERFTAGWFENLLVPVWIPEMPAVQAKLEAGADVADVGCGNGRGLIKLAEAFPNSRYVGYDIHLPNVERSRKAAEEAGVSDRVRFEQADVSLGLPESYDVIFTFDVVHDSADPAGLLATIRQSLRPEGRYVCVDINGSHNVEENTGPIGAFFYGFSLLYCMTTSPARDGVGLGTFGFNPHVAREMCLAAGFSDIRTLPLENPFNNVYEAW